MIKVRSGKIFSDMFPYFFVRHRRQPFLFAVVLHTLYRFRIIEMGGDRSSNNFHGGSFLAGVSGCHFGPLFVVSDLSLSFAVLHRAYDLNKQTGLSLL